MKTPCMLRCIVAAAIIVFGSSFDAVAQTAWPRQPIKLIVGLAPGAINDVQARVVAQELAKRVGQPVVVENRTGAGGNIAAEFVARAAPDGYTLLTAPTGTMVINPAVYSKLSYNPQKDFAPITQISTYPLYLAVSAGLPVKSVKELLEHAKANPEKANLGSPSTFFELMNAVLTLKSGAKFVIIPFKSTPETMSAILTGQTMIGYQDFNTIGQQVKAGKAKVLATMSARRSSEMPDVPTIVEAGFPEAVAQPFTGIVAPRATPAPVIKRLEAEINAVLKLPNVAERWRMLGLYAVDSDAVSFGKMIDREIERWRAVATAANIKLD